jgi:two-component system, NarL family, sensor kinase
MAADSLDLVTPLDPPEQRPARSRPRRELAAFLLIPVLVLAAVAAVTVVASERIARANALEEAKRTAVAVAQVLVAPVLADALSGIPGRRQELKRILNTRLRDGSIRTVVVWTAEGEIVLSSNSELEGERVAPSEELLAAIGGATVAHVDPQPETAYRSDTGPLVEVYVPLTVRGEPMAVETYFSYDGIDREASRLRWEIIPVAIGALILLQLVQIPIAMSLSRRVRHHERERAELMAMSLTASDRERRGIAADLHDGPVQDLAGISYALAGLRSAVSPERQDTVDRLVGAVRNALLSLRRLMVDIYPPDLSGSGLPQALRDLTEPLRAQGIDVSFTVEPPPEMSSQAAAAIYRTTKEALANVAKHAAASRVWVCLEKTEHNGAPAVELEIADDGVGYPETGTDGRYEGHLGLQVLIDRVADLGGTVELGRRHGGGAVMTAVIPLNHAE